jgi:hypothetical protein
MNDDGRIGWYIVNGVNTGNSYSSSTFFHGDYEGKTISEYNSMWIELYLNNLFNFKIDPTLDLNTTYDTTTEKYSFPMKELYHYIHSIHTFDTDQANSNYKAGYFAEIVNDKYRNGFSVNPRSNITRTKEYLTNLDRKLDDGNLSSGFIYSAQPTYRVFIRVMKRI